MSDRTKYFDRLFIHPADHYVKRTTAQEAKQSLYSRLPSTFTLSTARRCLAASDVMIVILAAVVSKLVYLDMALQENQPWWPYLLLSFGLSCILCLIYKQMGLYEKDLLGEGNANLGNVIGGLALSFLTLFGALYAVKLSDAISRGWVGIWFGLAIALIIPARVLLSQRIAQGFSSGKFKRRFAIIGTEDFAKALSLKLLQSEGESSSTDLFAASTREPLGDEFRGDCADLEQIMSVSPYDRVIVGMPATETEAIRAIVRSLGAYTTELLICTNLTDQPLRTTGTCNIGNVRTHVVHLLPKSFVSWQIKRVFDFLFAAVALVLLSPIFLLVAIAVKLDSKGPTFFRQRRVGQNNVAFTIFKFRTMNVVEDGPVVVQAQRNDPRVTRVGRVLRSTSLDELPQFLNVLIGDMSVVGPRPHAIAHDNKFEMQFDQFARRRRVKPGITGWAQVNGSRGETREQNDVRRRMELDLYYIENWSIWLDIEIIVRTLYVVAKGAY